MPRRFRTGYRNHVAKIERHNGSTNSDGDPTYNVASDWVVVCAGWFCEKLATGGSEPIRGRQVTSQTRYVLIGEYFSAKDVETTDKLTIDGENHEILAVLDIDGDSRERRLETRVRN